MKNSEHEIMESALNVLPDWFDGEQRADTAKALIELIRLIVKAEATPDGQPSEADKLAFPCRDGEFGWPEHAFRNGICDRCNEVSDAAACDGPCCT